MRLLQFFNAIVVFVLLCINLQIQRDYGDGQAGSDMLGNTFIIVDMYKAIQAAVSRFCYKTKWQEFKYHSVQLDT